MKLIKKIITAIRKSIEEMNMETIAELNARIEII